MPACGHKPTKPESCNLCALYERSDARTRAALDRVPAQEAPRPTAPKRWKLNCVSLGPKLAGKPCGSDLHTCTRFGDVTAKLRPCKEAARDCQSCEHYADGAVAVPPPRSPIRAGVAVGSYGWPELIRLQILTIRESCGPVPILVADDATPDAKALEAVCAAYPDVTLRSNPRRIGHTGGDVSAFHKAVVWGRERGLDVVAKLSQRFLATKPGWLAAGRKELLDSGLPLASRRCRGSENWDLRTEACLLDVRAWSAKDALARIAPRAYWKDAKGGLSAERVVFRALQDSLGGRYWPWSLIGEERYAKRDGVVWHNADGEAAYRKLAHRLGVTLDPTFHAEGRLRELKAGTYVYG
jgi:hypothetical protein